jgi:rubrerythrin
MAILKREPPGLVTSADELLAIAHAMELEAGRRYRELADHMRRQDEAQLAGIFAFLADVEDKHARVIDARAQMVLGQGG